MLDFPRCAGCTAAAPGQVLVHSHLSHPADLTSLSTTIQGWLASRSPLTLLLIGNMDQGEDVKGEVEEIVKEEVDEIISEVDPFGEEFELNEEEQFSANNEKEKIITKCEKLNNQQYQLETKVDSFDGTESTPKKPHKRMSAELYKRLRQVMEEKLISEPNMSSKVLKQYIREQCFNDEAKCLQNCVCQIGKVTFHSFVDRNVEKFKEKGSIVQDFRIGVSGRKKKLSDVCDECGFVASDKSGSMSKHMSQHHRVKACKECGEVLRERDMWRHKVARHKEKTFYCNVCGKSFKTTTNLKNHEVIHSEERAFPCRLGCGYASKTSGNRSIHEKKHAC